MSLMLHQVKGGVGLESSTRTRDYHREESVGSSLGAEALTLSSSYSPENDDGATVDPSE